MPTVQKGLLDMNSPTDRRTFLKTSLAAPAVAALAMDLPGGTAAAQTPPAAAPLPRGKIGQLEVSRMLLGGNLLTHYTHSRDLKYVYNLAAHYNTEAKILETLAVAEQNGINTLVVHTVPAILATLRKHRDAGGKIQWIICPTAPVLQGLELYKQQVEELMASGTEAVYLWGVHSDKLASQGMMDLAAEVIALGKSYGVPSGMGAHDLNVIVEAEKRKVNPDFYIKTFHHHHYPSAPKPEEIKGPIGECPGYWCANPEQTIEVMKAVERPWIAFKIMAAGAIPPVDAFQYAFENGADHALVGMFDFEIQDNANLIREVLPKVQQRTRAWRS